MVLQPLSECNVPGTYYINLYSSLNLIFTAVLQGTYCHPHFTRGKTEAQLLAKSHSAKKVLELSNLEPLPDFKSNVCIPEARTSCLGLRILSREEGQIWTGTAGLGGGSRPGSWAGVGAFGEWRSFEASLKEWRACQQQHEVKNTVHQQRECGWGRR